MSESKLQTNIKNRLKKMGFFTNKIVLCSRKGWPDLEAIRKGKTIYIEVKDKGKKLRPDQILIHEKLKFFGADVFTFDNIEDFDKELKKWMQEN